MRRGRPRACKGFARNRSACRSWDCAPTAASENAVDFFAHEWRIFLDRDFLSLRAGCAWRSGTREGGRMRTTRSLIAIAAAAGVLWLGAARADLPSPGPLAEP